MPGPEHPLWNGKVTLEDNELNRAAARLACDFYLCRGFMEAPPWEELGSDERFGWIGLVGRLRAGNIPLSDAAMDEVSDDDK